MEKSECVHEDVLLLPGWHSLLEQTLAKLELHDPNWGMAGAVGWVGPKQPRGHWSDPHKYHNTFTDPEYIEVERLDEQILIFRRSLTLTLTLSFDSNLPSIHNIGKDLARQLASKGKKSYAINAPTIHKYADATGNIIINANHSPKIMDPAIVTGFGSNFRYHYFDTNSVSPVEDRLIASVNWPEDGYCLFDIATLAPSSRPGFLGGRPNVAGFACRTMPLFARAASIRPFNRPVAGFAIMSFATVFYQMRPLPRWSCSAKVFFISFMAVLQQMRHQTVAPTKISRLNMRHIFGAPLHFTTPRNLTYFGSVPDKARRFLAPSKSGPK